VAPTKTAVRESVLREELAARMALREGMAGGCGLVYCLLQMLARLLWLIM
jgi:hypothetical protein